MLPVLTRSTSLPETVDWVDREFGRIMRRMWGDGSQYTGTVSYPVDMWEDDDHVYVEAELPGFSKDDLEITIEQGILHITAERQIEKKTGSVVNERSSARYFRSFTLPTSVDESKVEAKLDAGMLHLTLPKRPEVKPRRIKVT